MPSPALDCGHPPSGLTGITLDRLQIRLFGVPQILQDDVPLAISRTQVRALFFRLAADLEPVAREALCFLFWPDLPDKSARHHLSQLLSLLHHNLPEPAFLRVTSEHVTLDAREVWSDAAAFAALCKPSAKRLDQLKPALDLYRGPFLDGVYLPQCPGFEHWQLGERNRYEHLYLNTLFALLGDATARGAYAEAIDYAQRYLAVDELAEEVHRRLIELYVSAGDRSAALRQYERCATVLEQELGIAPMPEIRSALSAILETHPNNLPVQPTPLLGRKDEITLATALLRSADGWLVTLTGPGGSGKTRLGLEIAFELLPHFPHGAFFVDLASTQDPALLLPTISRTLGLMDERAQSIDEGLTTYLREKRILLLLDNFEHLTKAASQLARLRAGAPRLAILVTSRSPLHLRGEREVPVPPLPLPADSPDLPVERLLQYDSIRLFVDRVATIRPSFGLTQENAADIAAICIRLDGLPLAIELAAARCRMLAPKALLQRLANPLELLDAGSCDLPERQQTLRTTIAWSVALLSNAEQVLFRRLGVLAGPFTLASSEAVAGGKPELGIDILNGLSALVEHNLIRHEPAGDDEEPRFAMLETIRSYAFEQLAEHGELDMVRRRQEMYVLQLVARAEQGLRSPQQGLWRERLKEEHANVQLVFQRALDRRRTATAMMLAGGMWWYWFLCGMWNEGRNWLNRALENGKVTVSPQVRAKAVLGAGVLALFQGDHAEAQALLGESLGLYQTVNERQGSALVETFLGLLMLWRGNRQQAVTYLEESVAIFRELGDRWGLALALATLGTCTRTRHLLEESWKLWQESGDPWGMAESLAFMGDYALRQSDYAGAEAFYSRSLLLHRELEDKRGTALVCHKLGEALQHQGDHARAKPYYEESLALFRELGHRRDMAWCLYRLGRVARAQGHDQAAGHFLAESLYLFQALDLKRDLAGIFEELAKIAEAQQQITRAVQLLAVAATLRKEIETPVAPSEQMARDQLTAALRSRLAELSFGEAWNQGEKLTVEDAVAYALNTA